MANSYNGGKPVLLEIDQTFSYYQRVPLPLKSGLTKGLKLFFVVQGYQEEWQSLFLPLFINI